MHEEAQHPVRQHAGPEQTPYAAASEWTAEMEGELCVLGMVQGMSLLRAMDAMDPGVCRCCQSQECTLVSVCHRCEQENVQRALRGNSTPYKRQETAFKRKHDTTTTVGCS